MRLPRLLYVPAFGGVEELVVRVAHAFAEDVEGAAAVLVRPRAMSARVAYEGLLRVRDHTARFGARLFVRSRADLVRAVGADGLHLPSGGMDLPEARLAAPGRVVGAACHDEVELARRAGADYALVSPVFTVPGKGAPLGLAGARTLIAAASMPVYLLGGVTPANARDLRATGAAGLAVARAIDEAEDPARALCTFLSAT